MHVRTVRRVLSGDTPEPGYSVLGVLLRGLQIPASILFPDTPGSMTPEQWKQIYDRMPASLRTQWLRGDVALVPARWDEYLLLESLRQYHETVTMDTITADELAFLQSLRDLHVTSAEQAAMVAFYTSLRRMQGAPPQSDQGTS